MVWKLQTANLWLHFLAKATVDNKYIAISTHDKSYLLIYETTTTRERLPPT